MVALELVKTRFGDEKLLQATFIDSLLKLKPTSDSKDIKLLRNLYDSNEKCMRKLKSLEVTSESFGPMLIRLVVTKNITGDRWDFDEVHSNNFVLIALINGEYPVFKVAWHFTLPSLHQTTSNQIKSLYSH